MQLHGRLSISSISINPKKQNKIKRNRTPTCCVLSQNEQIKIKLNKKQEEEDNLEFQVVELTTIDFVNTCYGYKMAGSLNSPRHGVAIANTCTIFSETSQELYHEEFRCSCGKRRLYETSSRLFSIPRLPGIRRSNYIQGQ
jgi:hypothetical protein